MTPKDFKQFYLQQPSHKYNQFSNGNPRESYNLISFSAKKEKWERTGPTEAASLIQHMATFPSRAHLSYQLAGIQESCFQAFVTQLPVCSVCICSPPGSDLSQEVNPLAKRIAQPWLNSDLLF